MPVRGATRNLGQHLRNTMRTRDEYDEATDWSVAHELEHIRVREGKRARRGERLEKRERKGGRS